MTELSQAFAIHSKLVSVSLYLSDIEVGEQLQRADSSGS